MSKKIAIIGAGELGSRHLQAIAKCDFAVEICVIDPFKASLERAAVRFREIPANSNVKTIQFSESLDVLGKSQDLVIISTNSDARLAVVKNLLAVCKVENLILEKVLFTSLAEFDEADTLLKGRVTRTFVNCPKRGFESTKFMKERLRNETISFTVDGSNWGLACNAIHFVDQLAFLTGQNSFQTDTSKLDNDFILSKRAGYIEMTGELRADFAGGHTLKLISRKSAEVSFGTAIETKKTKISFSERDGELTVTDKHSGAIETVKFKPVYQSDLTQREAKSILFADTSSLPDFAVSAELHKQLIKPLLEFYNKVSELSVARLPIT